jgi:glycosyltransferase involved in cell wall biosynthesis
VRVLLIGREPDNASTRVRLLQYRAPLTGLGYEVRVLTWQPRSRLEVAVLSARAIRLARWADVVMISKPRLDPRSLAVLQRVNPRIVVDVDDAMWTWGDIFASRFDAGACRARIITAGNEFLADRLAKRYPHARVVRVPTAVDLDCYPARPPDVSPGPVTVGWIGNTASLTDFSEPVVEALRRQIGAGSVRLKVVSSRPLGIPDLPETFEAWSPQTEVKSLRGFDIGIMPLHDDEQAWGRCGLKAIQCMAVGVPVIASPIGAAPEIIDGTNGVLATSGQEWSDAVASLTSDTTRRQEMGARARDTIQREYSVAANLPRILEVFTSLVG